MELMGAFTLPAVVALEPTEAPDQKAALTTPEDITLLLATATWVVAVVACNADLSR